MDTQNLVIEFIGSFPGHLWVVLVAGLVTYFGLRAADASYSHETTIKLVTYAILLLLAILPNGYYAIFPPTIDMSDFLVKREPLPNYDARLYLDIFLTFVGWVIAMIARSRS